MLFGPLGASTTRYRGIKLPCNALTQNKTTFQTMRRVPLIEKNLNDLNPSSLDIFLGDTRVGLLALLGVLIRVAGLGCGI